MLFNVIRTRDCLQNFQFGTLFIEELGWSHPSQRKPVTAEAGGSRYTRTPIAELAGVTVFEVATGNEIPEASVRGAIQKDISKICHENLLIFTDTNRTQSLWYWVKREDGKTRPRSHLFIKGQPGDLFLSKLAGLVVDLSELDPEGNIPIVEVASRLKQALDIETVTKRFFTEFAAEHDRFLEDISGIPDDHDRRWYASVILNRLMFIWFLQKKLFLADGNEHYLPELLDASKKAGKNRFFSHTLRDLFFEGFAKPEKKRACIGGVPLGDIPYLNGGLFLPHGIEARIEGDGLFSGPFATIRIPDTAFEGVFRLFSDYSWSLNDTPGGNDKEINPDVLGYIFEKYINQKEFGAYYTRPEITEYLCEQTIHQLVLDAANKQVEASATLARKGSKSGPAPRRFETMSDLLLHAEGVTCRILLQEELPRLSLLDPACGSGAFLVAAMKTLLGITTALIGRCEAIGENAVLQWIKTEQKKHQAPLAYWVKKKIVTENLYGVDIMEEAVEIAKLRLFLALVASAERRDQLEPLPNIEFNLMPGNSLIGLLHVDPAKYESHTKARRHEGGGQERMSLAYSPAPGELGMAVESKTAPTRKEVVGAHLARQRSAKYEELLKEKNRLVALYKQAGDWATTGEKLGELKELTNLRDQIEGANRAAREILNKLLLDEFVGLGIKFEQATWDEAKGKEGRPEKRDLKIADIEALHPFHWAYEFDTIVVERGGFDAIITNPPWEAFKPQSKEFFEDYSEIVMVNNMTIKDFEKEQSRLLAIPATREAWLEYLSRFPHVSAWYRSAEQYANQISIVDGKKAGSDINLYKLFTEQCVHLLKKGGRCGTVIPTGIYTDLGSKQLRQMLFTETAISSLFGLANERFLFEGVDHRFKIAVITLRKGQRSDRFPAAFRVTPREAVGAQDLDSLFHNRELQIEIAVADVEKFSPDSLSILEFRNARDYELVTKTARFPRLGEELPGLWYIRLQSEFHMTNDSYHFHEEARKGRWPLVEGKMVHQFNHAFAEPRYWLDEKEARKAVLGRTPDQNQTLDYQTYRMGFRKIARSSDERTLISAVLPPSFHSESFQTVRVCDERGERTIANDVLLYLCALWNSLTVDCLIRLRVSANVNFFYVYQLPIPRLTNADPAFRPLVERAARLVGTTPEFDDLLKEIFGPKANHKTHGVTEPFSRQTLRAEIDALVARLYDLTEVEFAHILGTFPLVNESVKQQTLNTYRDLLRLGKLPDTRL